MSQTDIKGERVATIPVAPGIFVLRYCAAKAPTPPRLFLRASPASENSVALFFAPGADSGVLSAPGSYALVIAERSGRIQLTIVGVPGEDDGAEIKIEPLGKLIEATASASIDETCENDSHVQEVRPVAAIAPAASAEVLAAPRRSGRPPAAAGPIAAERARPARHIARENDAELTAPSRAPKKAALELNASGFGFVCHVARKGDVGAAGGRWIGGPGSPAVIEGVMLHWPEPEGVRLEVQALVSGSGGQWSPWVQAGDFAGTRGQSLPLVGLRVRIAGGQGRYRLQGEAIFLGLPAVADAGEILEFSSYAGVDPLVGLRLELAPAERTAPTEKAPDAPGPELKKPATGLRVFKPMRAEERAV